jgi:hypothetical protein
VSRRFRNLSASLTVAAAATAIAACGGSDDPGGDKLPSTAADELRRQLTSVEARVGSRNGGACDDIFDPDPSVGNIGPIDETMGEIPSGVDPEVRAALEQSIDRLKELVDTECEEIVAEDERERSRQEELAPEEEIPTPPPTTEEEVTTEPTTTEPGPDPPPETPEDDEGDEEQPGRGPDGEGPPGLGGGGVEAPAEGGEE